MHLKLSRDVYHNNNKLCLYILVALYDITSVFSVVYIWYSESYHYHNNESCYLYHDNIYFNII